MLILGPNSQQPGFLNIQLPVPVLPETRTANVNTGTRIPQKPSLPNTHIPVPVLSEKEQLMLYWYPNPYNSSFQTYTSSTAMFNNGTGLPTGT
jgi:hypothetical protein